MEGMNVLSLFDGMGCSWIALKEAGILVNKAYASEIDKFAIKQTQLNFPDTIQLGDVTKWKEWDIDWKSIDLVLAGSPCQGFSFAGKQLAFDDPRSKLFFVFIDILNHIRSLNPDVLFLLENVNMKKDYMKVISEYCGVSPVNINSNLVSAQNRNRWYWTNIHEHIPQPIDKGILLKDILEDEVDEKYYVSQAVLDRLKNPHKNFSPKVDPEKTGCLSTGNNSAKMSFDSGTTFISVVQKDNLIIENALNKRQKANYKSDNQKANSFLATSWKGSQANGMTLVKTGRIRRLTPTECARLQTVPDWYKWECSDTQIYKMLGNGWTVDAIAHILSFIKNNKHGNKKY